MRIKRFTATHEQFAALHDYAAAHFCPASDLDRLADILSGSECTETDAFESAYALIENTPYLSNECESLDMTFCEYTEYVSSIN